MRRNLQFSTLVLLVFAVLAASPATAAPASPVADVLLGVGQVEWVPSQEFAGLKLTVSGPDGVTEHIFGAGENPRFDLASLAGSIDGIYNWELTASPVLDANVRSVMAESRVDGAGDGARSRPAGLPPRDSLIQSGSFRVVDGAIVQPADEAGSPTTTTTGDPNVRRVTAADQVIPDDLIVQMSLCVGFDCVNNENFGFDTIRLKENNLRIHFDDTSSTGSFPNRDWRLVANDSANGGRNVFFLEDSTASREVFSVEAGAPSNALWVDSTGNIGAGTSTPVLQLHIKDGNTPGMRLEQDNSSGFTAQTWDVAGNEANFFVRDVTGGSLLSFRIRPGAPSSSIDIAASGNVGIGAASPTVDLHILKTAEAVTDVQFKIETNTDPAFDFAEQDSGVTWRFINNDTALKIVDIGTGSDAAEEFALTQAGNLTITGQLVTGGPQCGAGTPCDGVFSPDFEVESIENHAAQMWSNSFLPAIGPTLPNAPFNVSEKMGGVLNELEKAHIYIAQLDDRLKQKSDEVAQLRERLAALEAALGN